MVFRLALLAFFAWSTNAPIWAQDIRIYSEFQRFDPFGNPIAADRDFVPREILSPAMARNGHLSVHVVITGRTGSNYFLYAATNPPGILKVKIYREHFTPCANGFCPDWLTPEPSPSFGAIPELISDPRHPAMNRQTSRSYLFDIWAKPDTPPRRVRVEALIKAGTWYVAPMEVRIVAPTVPAASAARRDGGGITAEDVAPLDAPASATAAIQLSRYLGGLSPEWPPRLLRLRDVIQRNAAEDMLLARSLEPGQGAENGPEFPELNLLSWFRLSYPHVGAEWYLKVRDFLYRFDR